MVLGVKSVSNFNYDYCKFNFQKLIKARPSFVMGYWGLAMCYSQLLWRTESPATSHDLLVTVCNLIMIF